MSEQLSLALEPQGNLDEENVYERMRPIFLRVLDRYNIDHNLLVCEKKKNFSSVMLSSYLVTRLCFHGTNSYFEIPNGCIPYLSSSVAVSPAKNNSLFSKIELTSLSSIDCNHQLLEQIIKYSIERIPKEYDCCSRYLACSDAKRCINPHKDIALGCGYKLIVQNGRIFYGENRNID